MKKRLLAILLTVALVVGMLSSLGIVSAEGEEPKGKNTAINVPSAVTGLVYNGQEQTGVVAGTGYTITGNTATDAGDYTATATPTEGYEWQNGPNKTSGKDIKWKIEQANQTPTVTVVSQTSTSVTVTCNDGIGDKTYACKATAGKPGPADFNNTTGSFTGLTTGTTYYFYVKCAGNKNYKEATSAAKDVTPVPHTCSWTYEVSGTTITATCSVAGHEGSTTQSVTLVAPSGTLVYGDANTKTASLQGGASQCGDYTVSIAYGYNETAASNYETFEGTPANAGFYKASITAGEKTVSVEFEIEKADQSGVTLTAPTVEATSVTLASTGGVGTASYGYCSEDDADEVTNWQSGTAFSGLTQYTEYYFFVKYAGTSNYNAATKSISVTTKHAHSWVYTASGATITAECVNDGHEGDDTDTATIVSPGTDLVFDDKVKAATIEGSKTKCADENLTIKYSYSATADGEYTDVNEAKKAGYYKAYVTVDTNKTAFVEFSIAKATTELTLEVEKITDNSIKVKGDVKCGDKVLAGAKDKIEYAAVKQTGSSVPSAPAADSALWKSGKGADELKNLDANTTYYIFARYPGDDNHAASANSVSEMTFSDGNYLADAAFSLSTEVKSGNSNHEVLGVWQYNGYEYVAVFVKQKDAPKDASVDGIKCAVQTVSTLSVKNAENTTQVLLSAQATENNTCYAIYRAKKCVHTPTAVNVTMPGNNAINGSSALSPADKATVIFMNGDTELQKYTDIAVGSKPVYEKKTPEKSKEGYTCTFKGWSTNPDATTATYTTDVLPAVAVADSTTTYYAIYQEVANKHDVSYAYDKAYASPIPAAPATEEVAYGTVVTVASTSQEGYTFSGWTTDDANVADGKFTMPDNDVEFTGSWTANTYTVVFDANGGEGEMEDQDFTYGIAANLNANAFTLSGEEFLGWGLNKKGAALYDDEAEVKNLTSVNGGTVTLYAIWTSTPTDVPGVADVYGVFVKPRVTNGTVEFSSTTGRYGAKITVTVAPAAGYVLSELTVTSAADKAVAVTKVSDTQFTFVMPTCDVFVRVIFAKAGAFVDVPEDAYFAKAVEWAVARGITYGTDATHFSPYAPATRAQMVTFLWRAAGCPATVSKTCKFTDVPKGCYYEQAVIWAVEKGITVGVSETEFAPDMVVTRAQAVTFIARMAGVKDTAKGYKHDFSDVSASDYYNNAVAWAAENGITFGQGGGKFGPDNICDRSQIVTMLYRYFVK